MLSIIVAIDINNGMGNDNKLPWNIPEDLKYFKEKTLDKVIIMGRKTYESIGKPLPNRTNIVISRNTNLQIPGVEVFNSLEEAISKYSDQEIFIIGGSEIYKQSIQLVDRLYITMVNGVYNCDCFFPSFMEYFKLSRAEDYQVSSSGTGYRFSLWEKKKEE